ncbi:MAG: Rrf2 family transcriptional regulator [Bacteroidetes bacterium]|nr:Rrf2 family transcriptional regulator [Bacteroidota bacterium]MBP7397934.1 Rrf2 family transcriptional regulator [Chitinophagales bacterium]MBK7108893.1 Rrf2 family transcriptional regulator [Bacteroidota bacterium]MBK7109271.1 Rrf2 family transcriptional regulator [Bacteroidota bacterium]MBK8681461.1 Rrf2 family transcriptional regulator [Bacteroidota bacterium]
MLSKKAKYGLMAVFRLAKEYGKQPMLIVELAEQENIPRKFLEIILLELKNEGILISKMGKGGGYTLAKAPAKIKIGQVVRALDGPLAPIPCVSKTAYQPCEECVSERTCNIRLIMKQVREATTTILDSTSLADASKAKFSLSRL